VKQIAQCQDKKLRFSGGGNDKEFISAVSAAKAIDLGNWATEPLVFPKPVVAKKLRQKLLISNPDEENEGLLPIRRLQTAEKNPLHPPPPPPLMPFPLREKPRVSYFCDGPRLGI